MTRFVPVTVLMVMLAASRTAGAQAMTTFPSGSTILFQHRKIYDDSKNDGSFIEPDGNSTELRQYFNLAHCNCAKANLGDPTSTGWFQYLIHETMASGLSAATGVDFFIGTNCDTLANRTTTPTCTQDKVGSVADLDADLFVNSNNYQSFNLYQAVNANRADGTTECLQQNNVGNSIYALVVDPSKGGDYAFMGNQRVGALSTDTGMAMASALDTAPPPFPDSVTAAGIDSGIHLSWPAPTSNNTDIAYYQALCATVDGTSPALSSPSNSPQFVTTASLCGAGGDPPLMELAIDNSDPGATSIPAPGGDFGNLDKSFVCGESSSSTSTSLDIRGVENGTAYQVILLTIDLHGNYTARHFTTAITPIPSTDFWEDLHDRGSHVEGGLCLLAETYGDDSSLTSALRTFRDDTLGGSRVGRWLTRAYYASLGKLGGYVHGSLALRAVAGVMLAPLVALALLWHWLGLIGVVAVLGVVWLWRRRRTWLRRAARLGPRRRWCLVRLVPVVAAAAAVLAARPARAGGNQPYWDADQTPDNNASDEGGQVAWRVGFRIGPYTPDIDGQIGGSRPGPFEQMFGTSRHMLTTLDIDRVLWSGFGQVTVGLSLGYWQKTARAFTIDSLPTDNPRPRGADHNAFRMIPTALTAGYRFTWLDDEYAIPVVPYVRGGLSYYVWWISLTDGGGLAQICDRTGAACGNKAYGASLGVQGSIGLSIRAERIDASAAMSMRESGIQHAGIYGELSAAKVDGFGSDKKLSVGGTTWFAGVEFEF
jgi:hypothetical protein